MSGSREIEARLLFKIQSVKDMFAEVVEELAKLELIDIIRKLGLANLFAEEMQQTLQVVASSRNRKKNGEAAAAAAEELYPTALCFWLMRLHGYKVSQDTFNGFLDEKGNLQVSKTQCITEYNKYRFKV